MSAITVVIPVFRNRDRVARTIRSVLAQPDIDVRIIAVIDDQCSETREIVERLGVEVLSNKRNMGAPWCRNLGLALADSRFVMFLDSDDYLEGPLLAGICREMAATGADIGFGQTIIEREDGRPRVALPMPDEPGPAMFERWCTEKAFAAPCSVVWDAGFLRSIGGWDEALKRSQDSELVLRALLKGAKTCASTHGAGIYVFHLGNHRITRSGNLGSCLMAVEKLLAISPAAYPPEIIAPGLAVRAAQIASMAFYANDASLAERSLALARRLGLVTCPGRPATQRAIRMIGLRRVMHIRSWIMDRRASAQRPLRAIIRASRAPALNQATART